MRLLPSFNDCLNYAAAQASAAVLITIARTKGSAPRNAGTRMAVALGQGAETSLVVGGTIGGGNLEFKALEIARQWLEKMRQSSINDALEMPEYRAFPLGASLGQCCGGWVEMRFEVVSHADNVAANSWVQKLRAAAMTPTFNVMLFGAGHVAHALVPMLVAIGATIKWVDNREGAFEWSGNLAHPNVETISTDAPEAEITNAASGTHFIVMTHSHALDQTLTHAMLQRDDANFYGLIGSRTKGKLFEKRLTMRGYNQLSLSKLTCPLGIVGIKSKEPSAIALAIAAQLQQHREQRANGVHSLPQINSNNSYA